MTLKEFAKQAMCGKKHKKKKAGAFVRTKVAQEVVTSASRYKPPRSNIRHLTSKSKLKIPGVRIVSSKSKKI